MFLGDQAGPDAAARRPLPPVDGVTRAGSTPVPPKSLEHDSRRVRRTVQLAFFLLLFGFWRSSSAYCCRWWASSVRSFGVQRSRKRSRVFVSAGKRFWAG